MRNTIVIAELVETVPLTMVGNLPCPFCGGVNLSRLRPRDDLKHGWIECETCGATGPNNTAENCAALWNARAFGSEIFMRLGDSTWLNHLSDQQMDNLLSHIRSLTPHNS